MNYVYDIIILGLQYERGSQMEDIKFSPFGGSASLPLLQL